MLLLAQTAAGSGLSLQLTRELAARPERARGLVARATTFAHLCGAGAAALLAGYALLAHGGDERTAILVLALAVLPSGEMAVQEGVLIGGGAHRRVAAIAGVESAAKLLLAGVALAAGGGLALVCAAVAAARWIGCAYGRRVAARTLDAVAPAAASAAPQPSLAGFARETLPWAALFTLSIAYFRVDLFAVQAFRGGSAVGHYGAAATLLGIILIAPNSVTAVVYPRLAAAFATRRADFARNSRRAIAGMAAAALPPALLVVLLAEPLLALAYGAAFVDGAPALRLLALGLPIHAANAIAGSVLQAAGRYRAMVRVVGIALVAHVALAVALVPRWGLTGAAAAMLAASTVGTVAVAVELWPVLGGSLPSLRRRAPAATTS